jgi:hypothetical protein
MTGLEIVTACVAACELADCNKFEGHLAVEILKQALADEGIAASARDVFIKGVPVEWDLLVPRVEAAPLFNGLLYEPAQANVAIEVKLSGLCGSKAKALSTIRGNFKLAQAAGVQCVYVAFCESQSGCATDENLGFPCFNLTWSHKPKPREDSGDWPRLLRFLRGAACEYIGPSARKERGPQDDRALVRG